MSKQSIIRGVLQNCQICNKKYGLLSKQHICKRCLRSVCADCTEEKQPIFEKKEEKRKPHRLCAKCKPEVTFIESYKKHYKLVFGSTCSVGKQWTDKLNGQAAQHPPAYQKLKKDQLRSRSDLWASMTFSYKNFVGLNCLQLDWYAPLKSVYEKCSYPNCSEYCILFFLCHCQPQSVLSIMNCLCQKLENSPPKKDQVIRNLQFLGCNSNEINSMKPYLQHKFDRFVLDLSFNHVTIEISLFIISGVINQGKSNSPLEKCLAILLFSMKDAIVKNNLDFQKIQTEGFQTVKVQDFETNMRVMFNKEVLEKKTEALKNESKQLRQTLIQTEEEFEMERTCSRLQVSRNNSVAQQLSQFDVHNLRSQNELLKDKLAQLANRSSQAKSMISEDSQPGNPFAKLETLNKQITSQLLQIQDLSNQLLSLLD